MYNITDKFKDVSKPYKALVFFKGEEQSDIYVESYDMDDKGTPINAHPLTVSESAMLSEALEDNTELKTDYLKSRGIMPKNVLFIDPAKFGFAIWYTPPQEVSLFFKKQLGIDCGKALVPGLVWKATQTDLEIFALADNKPITEETVLFYAPFFNINSDSEVCMGTVDIDVNGSFLEEFMSSWESYFFNSYFSHLFDGHIPVKTNIIQLWNSLINTGKPFPAETLIKSKSILKDLL
ncbi:MAG: PRTRC system protein B [Bacteroidota bacterium]